MALTARRRIVVDRRGANLVEYILLVGVLALVAFAAFKAFGASARGKIDEQSGAVGDINGEISGAE